MKPSKEVVINSCVAVLVIGIIVFLMLHNDSAQQNPTSASTASSDSTDQSLETDPAFRKELSDALSAYYSLSPEDTESSRRARILPFTTNEFVDFIDLTVNKSSVVGSNRRSNDIALNAVADMTQAVITFEEGTPYQSAYVEVPVDTQVTSADSSDQSIRITSYSEWQNDGSGWKLRTISELSSQ